MNDQFVNDQFVKDQHNLEGSKLFANKPNIWNIISALTVWETHGFPLDVFFSILSARTYMSFRYITQIYGDIITKLYIKQTRDDE